MNHLAAIITRAEAGCRRRYGHLSDQLQTQLAFEIDLLRAKGGAYTLLMAADIADYARENSIEMEFGVACCHSLLCYALGIAHIDPIQWGLYAERLLSPPKPLRLEIGLDAHWVERINAHFGLTSRHSVRVLGWHHSTEFAQCQDRVGKRIEILDADANALAQFQAPSCEGLFQCRRIVPFHRPIRSLADLVDVWHEVHDGQTRYQEEILDLAVGVGYTVMHALRLVDRLRQGEPDLVALERAHFAEFAQSQGRSLAAANVLFDSFLRGGVPRASAVYNAMLAYRSAYLKAHHPAAWLETILSWRQGLSMDHPLMQEFARLGVEKQAMKDRLQGENRSRDEQRHSRRGNKEQA